LEASGRSASQRANQQRPPGSCLTRTPSGEVCTASGTSAPPFTRSTSVSVRTPGTLSTGSAHGAGVVCSQWPALLVNAQAMAPFDPATSSGVPGSVTPVASSCEGTMSRMRYHTGGTRSDRCMSLATSPAPSAVSRPASAQLLLPTSAGCRQSAHGSQSAGGPDRGAGRACAARRAGVAARTSSSAAVGICTSAGATAPAVSAVGLSQAVRAG